MKNTNSKVKLFYLIGFCLILLLPILNVPPWFSPPAWGKTIVFRIILAVLIFLFLRQLLNPNPFRNTFLTTVRNVLHQESRTFWPFCLLISFLGIIFLSTIFSLNPHFSFWGSPYRSDGTLNLIFYIIFAILAFLTLRPKDWKKLWDVAFIGGILVSLIAIFQKFGLISSVFIPYDYRVLSTMGGAIFLALYLLLLSFPAFSFAIKTKSKKRFFYFFSFALFIFVIILTATRAIFLGLTVGFLFFIFFYPNKNRLKKIRWLKISAGIILLFLILVTFSLNSKPELVQSLRENKVVGPAFHRTWGSVQSLLDIQDFSFRGILNDNRSSGWQIALQSLKDRPILGYGPGNFSIAFDKYYDPTLSGFGGSDWWDRAHNFIFDISVTAGIPALIIYLSLFGVLFFQFQKLKNFQRKSAIIDGNQSPIIYHGIQATFLAYLTANFFSFDVFSTYLISFLLIGYSLHLIYSNSTRTVLVEKQDQSQKRRNFGFFYRYRKIIIFALFACLIWFIWSANLKPLKINKEMNWAEFYMKTQKCDKALEKMEEVLSSHSVLDNYVGLQYIELINNCLQQDKKRALELAQKGIDALKKSVKLRPYYTRSWLFLGNYTNYLIDRFQTIQPELVNQLKQEADSFYGKAYELSPKRKEIFLGWVETLFYQGRFQTAKEKTNECIEVTQYRTCWWQRGLANIYLGKIKEGEEDIKIAEEKGYNIEAKKSLLQLIKVYSVAVKTSESPEKTNKIYQALSQAYEKVITGWEIKNFQYHASLSYIYKMLGDYEKAREEAKIVLNLSPESKVNVEEFLRTLR